jgi:hypothetical protein
MTNVHFLAVDLLTIWQHLKNAKVNTLVNMYLRYNSRQ